jgi:hypothetical protein
MFVKEIMRRKPRHLIKAKMLPLIVMTLGTILLAIPTTILILDTFKIRTGPDLSNENAAFLLLLTLSGLALLLGYLWTLVSRRFSLVFWLFSALYNLVLTSGYLYAFIPSLRLPSPEYPDAHVSLIVLFFLLWMIFMTAGSFYYTYRAFLQRSLRLP